jgi:hypothetical protein
MMKTRIRPWDKRLALSPILQIIAALFFRHRRCLVLLEKLSIGSNEVGRARACLCVEMYSGRYEVNM